MNTRTTLVWAVVGLMVPSAGLIRQACGEDQPEVAYEARQPVKVRQTPAAALTRTRSKSSKPAQRVTPVGAEETERALRELYRKDGRTVPDGALPSDHPVMLKRQGPNGQAPDPRYEQMSQSAPAPGGYPTGGPTPQKKPSFWSKMVPGFMKRDRTPQPPPQPRQMPEPQSQHAERAPGSSGQYQQNGQRPQYPAAQPQYPQVQQAPRQSAPQQQTYQAPNRLPFPPSTPAQPRQNPAPQPTENPDAENIEQDELLVEEPRDGDNEKLTVLDEKPSKEAANEGPTIRPAETGDAPDVAESDPNAASEEESPFSGQKVDLTHETDITRSEPTSRPAADPPALPKLPSVPEVPTLTEGEMPKLLSPAEELDGLKGYCLVTLKADRKLVGGEKQFSVTYRNQIYRFASAEAKAEFERSPETYAPAHNGRDVVRMADGVEDAEGSIDHAVWYRGRLFMFANAESRTAFVSAPSKFAASVVSKK